MMIVRVGPRASPALRSGRAVQEFAGLTMVPHCRERSDFGFCPLFNLDFRFDQAKRDCRRKHQRTQLVQDLDLLPSQYLEPTNGDGYAKASQEQVPIIDFLHPTITTSNFG